jgi:alanine racemase
MRHTIAVISKQSLAHNVARIRSIAGEADIIAVIKANAYGHGMIGFASELIKLGINFFGVAYADEGIILRENGFSQKIIVLVPETNGNAKLCVDFDLTPVIYSFEFAEALSAEATAIGKQAKGHLFIDTGMNREGLRTAMVLDFMKKAESLKNLTIEGFCTHFATSTNNLTFANQQLNLFNQTLDELHNNGYEFKYKHAANSGGIVNLPESRMNLVRPGMTLYGYPPAADLEEILKLKPIMTLKTKVISVRRIYKGDTVGYGLEYISEKERSIATIPIGYGDGYMRGLTHKAQCLIGGNRYDFVGTICMDVAMIDIGDDDIKCGDEVVLIGRQGDDFISAYELSDKLGTIPYEVTSAISARVPRVYVD